MSTSLHPDDKAFLSNLTNSGPLDDDIDIADLFEDGNQPLDNVVQLSRKISADLFAFDLENAVCLIRTAPFQILNTYWFCPQLQPQSPDQQTRVCSTTDIRKLHEELSSFAVTYQHFAHQNNVVIPNNIPISTISIANMPDAYIIALLALYKANRSALGLLTITSEHPIRSPRTTQLKTLADEVAFLQSIGGIQSLTLSDRARIQDYFIDYHKAHGIILKSIETDRSLMIPSTDSLILWDEFRKTFGEIADEQIISFWGSINFTIYQQLKSIIENARNPLLKKSALGRANGFFHQRIITRNQIRTLIEL